MLNPFAAQVLDAVGASLLLLVGLWLHDKEDTAGRLYKKYVCTPSDYTVALSRWSLPSDYETLDELAQRLHSHFEHVLSKAPVVSKPGNVTVADINFGINNRRVIRLMKKRGALARNIDVLDARVRLIKAKRDRESGCCKITCGKTDSSREELENAKLRSRARPGPTSSGGVVGPSMFE